MPTTEHTLKQFDAELEAIRALVLQMGGLVEEQTVRAMEALTAGNMQLVAADLIQVQAYEILLPLAVWPPRGLLPHYSSVDTLLRLRLAGSGPAL